jgi:hypothetical protein
MDLIGLDFDQPARVLWQNPSRGSTAFAGRERRFASISNAVRFVMEDLSDLPQSIAWIVIDGGTLKPEDIRQLYSKLPPRNGRR